MRKLYVEKNQWLEHLLPGQCLWKVANLSGRYEQPFLEARYSKDGERSGSTE